MTIDCYFHLAEILPQKPAVLATVIATQGSVPREVGAKMIIYGNGPTNIYSTIGGGAGEAKVIRQAIEVWQTGVKQAVEIDLSGATHRETQGICGGKMQVWLERWQGETAIALLDQILSQLQTGQSATLVTPFAADRSPYLLTDPITDPTTDPMAVLDAAAEPAFVEVLQPPPTLLIIGAGHVAEQLAKVAALLGFQIAVQDDRPDWANPQRYPQAAWISHTAIETTLQSFVAHSQLYVALVTRGYQYDLAALLALVERDRHSTSPCRYIGMIGSEKRVRQVLQQVRRELELPHPALAAIHAPIGLDIGALTPAEIAVSIGAELVLVRRGGTGCPLSSLMQR